VVGRLINQSGDAAFGSEVEARNADHETFRAKRGKKIFALIFSYQDGLSWYFHTLKTSKRGFQTI